MRPVVPLMAACLAACGGGGGMSENSAMNPDSTMNAPTVTAAAKINFTAFTEKLISSRSETEEPLGVVRTDFYFPDDDNEAAFAAVVPAT